MAEAGVLPEEFKIKKLLEAAKKNYREAETEEAKHVAMALIAELGDGEAPAALRNVLVAAPYSPREAERLDAADYAAAGNAMRRWIDTAATRPARRAEVG